MKAIVLERLREPSTISGLVSLLAVAAHVSLSSQMISAIAGIVIAAAGLFDVIREERT